MRGHRGKSGQGRSNRGRQRAPSNTAELFRNTTLMDIAPPKNVEIQADVLDLAELHSTAFWSKVMDIFSLLASKDAPCSACARALQGVRCSIRPLF